MEWKRYRGVRSQVPGFKRQKLGSEQAGGQGESAPGTAFPGTAFPGTAALLVHTWASESEGKYKINNNHDCLGEIQGLKEAKVLWKTFPW